MAWETKFISLDKIKENSLTLANENLINEDQITQLLKISLPEILENKNIWIESKVNPWYFRERGKFIPKDYLHPFQPDIDLLFGPIFMNQRFTPLNAIEIKFFKKVTTGVIPKTYEGGFYSGLGQSLALLIYGIDKVSLWHVFLLPHEKWGNLVEEKGKKFDRIIQDHREWVDCYIGIMKGLIQTLNLPIGYRSLAIILPKQKEDDLCLMYLQDRLNPRLNPLGLNETPFQMRELIKKYLNINEEIKNLI